MSATPAATDVPLPSLTRSRSVPCPAGGNMLVEATLQATRDTDTGVMEASFTGTRTLTACAFQDGEHTITVDGHDVVPDVHEVLDRMAVFAERVRNDERITDVVNIGIGGSDLGPAMASRALAAYGHPRLRAHFVSNVDGADVDGVLSHLDPASTLFVVASKTFGTIETLTNAHTARTWLVEALGDAAVSEKQVFKVVFHNQGEVWEIFAHEISQGGLFCFVEIEGLSFGNEEKVVVDPSQERLEREFEGVSRTYVPMHAVIRIDEVAKEGTGRISKPAGDGNVTVFPTPLYAPKGDSGKM